VDPIQKGELYFTLKGCNACHMVNGRGAIGPGPDLSLIGSTPYDSLPNDAEFLALWLKDPVAQKSDAIMPRLGLTDGEIEALVAYLTSLK
jgi:mono/diheme cytochrome c family protein